ncbi:hypothetical protein FBU30_010527 [Linnemannia zychae]|nr:hypothetical protein FBU30_010527 [Linnemannia zychae]
MQQGTAQETSSSSSFSSYLFSEGSSSNSNNTGGQGSSSNLIDLTIPRPPRLVHPRTLPSQTIEIIDLSSDDETSYNSNNYDDEVQFVSETPGTSALPGSSNASARPQSQPSRTSDLGLGNSHSNMSAAHRAFVSAMRTPPPPPPPSRPEPAAGFLLDMFARWLGEDHDRHHRGGTRRRGGRNGHMADHRQFHYWDDNWDLPTRDRSPSDIGDLLERFVAFDGAPPAATEAEIERERHEIETKPVVTRPGFTKTIDPQAMITCPLCTREFGHEGDKRPTLWVIVGCGHVVCGICAEEIFISRKCTKVRRQPIPKKTKGKGKAKWSPEPTDTENGGEDGITLDGVRPTSPTLPATAESNIKISKRVMGCCPGCQRKIKRTSLQQLYL